MNIQDIKFIVQLYELDTDNEYDEEFIKPERDVLRKMILHFFYVHEHFDTNKIHLHFSTAGDGGLRCETESEFVHLLISISPNENKSFIYYEIKNEMYDIEHIVTNESILWYLLWVHEKTLTLLENDNLSVQSVDKHQKQDNSHLK